eukprot:gene5279-3784_t
MEVPQLIRMKFEGVEPTKKQEEDLMRTEIYGNSMQHFPLLQYYPSSYDITTLCSNLSPEVAEMRGIVFHSYFFNIYILSSGVTLVMQSRVQQHYSSSQLEYRVGKTTGKSFTNFI